MKVAILSESEADESAVRILVGAILGEYIQRVDFPRRARGWPSVLQVLPVVMKHLQYQTDADTLIVVADSNHSQFHIGEPDEACPSDQKCRLCQLQDVVLGVENRLRDVVGRTRLRTCVGLAVPAIEAWYLCGGKLGVSEAAWREGFETRKYPYTKNQLKRETYGTDRPSIGLETEHAIEHAQRLAQDLSRLEQKFPVGFGALVRALKRT